MKGSEGCQHLTEGQVGAGRGSVDGKERSKQRGEGETVGGGPKQEWTLCI